jgi:hypothetical protein
LVKLGVRVLHSSHVTDHNIPTDVKLPKLKFQALLTEIPSHSLKFVLETIPLVWIMNVTLQILSI